MTRRFTGPVFTAVAWASAAWALWVFASYFRRPLDFSSLAAMFALPSGVPAGPLEPGVWFESAALLLLSSALAASLVVLGGRLARFLAPAGGLLDTLPARFALGAALADAVWVGTGLCGLWRGPLPVVMGAILLLQGLGPLVRQDFNRFPVKIAAGAGAWGSLSLPARVLGILGGLYLLLSLGHGMVPETFYDSMVYHLAVPAYWLSRGGITDHPLNFFSNYPYGGEMVLFNGYLWGPLFGSQAAKLLNVAALLMAALAAGDWAREAAADREAGWLAGVLLITTPLLALNAWTTQLECLLCLFILLFLRAFTAALSGGGTGAAIAAGLFAGMALSVKYTAVLGLGAGALAVLLASRGAAGRARACLAASLAALPPVLPWVAKNAAFTGNPFHPYLAGWFDGRRLPAWGYERLLAEQREMHVATLKGWLTLPWDLAMREPVGPMLLALLPLALLFRVRGGTARALGVATALFFASALAVTHHVRFLLAGFAPAYVLLAVLSAAAPSWARRALLWAAAAAALLGLPMLSNVSRYYYSCGGVWRGVETRASYLGRPGRAGAPLYQDLAGWVNANLPGDAVLLVAGDARTLYYERTALSNSVFDDPVLPVALRQGLDAEAVLRRLKRLGVTHLAVNAEEGLRSAADYRHYEMTPDEWTRLDDFSARCLEPAAFLPDQAVYRLRDAPLAGRVPARPGLFCLMSKEARDYVRALGSGDWDGAARSVERGLAACPGTAFWWEQKAQLESRAGRVGAALECFAKASERGILRPGAYRVWAELLESSGRGREAAAVRKASADHYPAPSGGGTP
jgi:hypothetical protein